MSDEKNKNINTYECYVFALLKENKTDTTGNVDIKNNYLFLTYDTNKFDGDLDGFYRLKPWEFDYRHNINSFYPKALSLNEIEIKTYKEKILKDIQQGSASLQVGQNFIYDQEEITKVINSLEIKKFSKKVEFFAV